MLYKKITGSDLNVNENRFVSIQIPKLEHVYIPIARHRVYSTGLERCNPPCTAARVNTHGMRSRSIPLTKSLLVLDVHSSTYFHLSVCFHFRTRIVSVEEQHQLSQKRLLSVESCLVNYVTTTRARLFFCKRSQMCPCHFYTSTW